ncbi:MAG: heme o synthase [Gammaproteobacteria bacterium]|nr:heme o synthase [Gammaproteobacteria bacterium]MDH3411113.1 heme o synthase [Gammaproteobacteria bacterium]
MSIREYFISERNQRAEAIPAWREYLVLCKPRVVSLIVFTAVIGMFLSTEGMAPLAALVFGTLGIGLAASAGAAINHIADQRIDAVMARTRGRPLPTGRLDTTRAVVFAGVLCAISMLMLISMVNTLTAALTFASMIGYSVIYTVFLKWRTPQNIVIGGAAGAMPPVLGWTAVTDSIDPHALLLFLIIFAWTPPHFWALAIHRKDDYARADIPMLPVTHGVAFTRTYVLLYTVVLFVVSLLPFVTRMSGVLYLAAALILGAGFLYQALVLYRGRDRGAPYRTFKYSIHYLSGLFAALLVDHYIPVLVG